MNATGQTVCLCMIVKNEAPVIRRCLDSVRPIIDRWVIVDTGSTDGTQEIIREHFRDLPGEVQERPWQDFAHNRSEALELARGQGDYVFVIDADEVLEIEPGFAMPRLEADSYNLMIHYGGCCYLRKQLVRNALPWRYEGVLHEYITCELAVTEAFLPGLSTTPHHDGARARDANTYRRDALILEKALIDTPNNTRYVFYLAQSYRDAGDHELSLRHYKRRVEMGGWAEEVWFSLYQIAQLRERMGHAWPEVMESYLAAFQYLPDRAGPLYHIAMHYQAKAEYHVSHLYFARAMRVPRPGPNRLFVEQALYDFQIALEYAVSCYYAGQHSESIAVNNALLRSGLLPAHAIDQVIRNRRFSVDVLHAKPSAPDPVARWRVVVPFLDAGPELDDTVESLQVQQGSEFNVVFLGRGSSAGSSLSDAVPLEDPRFSLLTCEAGSDRAAVEWYVRAHCEPDDAVMVLPSGDRLAEPETLKRIADFVQEAGCMLAYGQYRNASGQIGLAEPAQAEAEFLASGGFRGNAPIALRAALVDLLPESSEPDPSWRDLFLAAGFRGTGFSDDVWTCEKSPVVAPPLVVSAAAGKLPSISCLMVTLDRLSLAKRSILSWAAQTYPERELVIVTDGKPRFREALERFVAALGLERVRFVYPQGEGLTLGALRNISLEAARGDLVCQWDDDDFSHPDRLMIQAGHMIRQNASACCLTDHLQLIEDKRMLCWVDWTMDGAAQDTAQLAPGTIMMGRDARFRYPEAGQYARQGEDSVLLNALSQHTPVVPLSGAGYLYLYQYHGRNTFSREHHYRISSCRTTVAHLNQNADKIREAARHCPIAKPCFVIGSDGPAFALN
jgi:glycosyltransferase involved in cell wall biosynthesis